MILLMHSTRARGLLKYMHYLLRVVASEGIGRMRPRGQRRESDSKKKLVQASNHWQTKHIQCCADVDDEKMLYTIRELN